MRIANMIVLAALSTLAVDVGSPSSVAAQTAPPTVGNSAQTGSDESLSSKLNKSGGVITPNTSVDQGIKVPAPDPHPNSMPVIPPSANGGSSAK